MIVSGSAVKTRLEHLQLLAEPDRDSQPAAKVDQVQDLVFGWTEPVASFDMNRSDDLPVGVEKGHDRHGLGRECLRDGCAEPRVEKGVARDELPSVLDHPMRTALLAPLERMGDVADRHVRVHAAVILHHDRQHELAGGINDREDHAAIAEPAVQLTRCLSRVSGTP